jgi:hypothetical protein
MYTVIPLIAAYFWVYERLHAETYPCNPSRKTDIRTVGAVHGDSPNFARPNILESCGQGGRRHRQLWDRLAVRTRLQE